MTRRSLFLSFLGLMFGNAACAPLAVSTSVREGRAGLRYGEDPRQSLEVHRPPRGRDWPVIVLIRDGDRDAAEARALAQAWAGRGLLVFLADRRAARGREPAFISDAAAAIAWAADHAADFGGDASRLGVTGLGAGADAALMIALDRRYMAGRDGLIRAAAALKRPPVAVDDDPTLTRPEAYVRSDAPTIWLGGGQADDALAARIRSVGGRVQFGDRGVSLAFSAADFLLDSLAASPSASDHP
ncbi:acetyl esterase/lipase [Brevundimonas faecalis]|uniref:Acetyl esterase/lipase n=1 Tax=Brevundimonas faecalis TaxID=947378 RepID=A0ABV2RBL1_9CAUL